MTNISPLAVPGLRPAVLEAIPYQAGQSAESLQSELNLVEITKLASNENPYGPYPGSIRAMRNEVANLNTYPDIAFTRLRDVLGHIHDLAPDCICLSHGAEGMLQTIGKCFLQPGDEVIVPDTTYALYREISKIMGATVVAVSISRHRSRHGIDLEAVAAAVTPRTKLIWLANPNNPTGTIFNRERFTTLLAGLPRSTWVVLDEAYAEFAEAELIPDRVALINRELPLMAVRTFSKAYGLAGARLGYVLAAPEVVRAINTVSEPFNANRVAVAGALAALTEDTAACEKAVRAIKTERRRTEQRLAAMNLRVIGSHANFVLFGTPYPAETICRHLLQKGVIVRSGHIWGLDNMVRVTIGTPSQMQIFFDALIEVLNKLATKK